MLISQLLIVDSTQLGNITLFLVNILLLKPTINFITKIYDFCKI